MSPASSDPGQLERELDQARTRLDGHLSELQQLSPGQLLDDAMRYLRGAPSAAFGRNHQQSLRRNPNPPPRPRPRPPPPRAPAAPAFGRNLLQSGRGNPIPAAITGIGLTWLMASNPRPGTVQAQDAPDRHAQLQRRRLLGDDGPHPHRRTGRGTPARRNGARLRNPA